MTESLPGLDLPAVREWLAAQGVETPQDLTASLLAGGRSNLTYELRGPGVRWVLRRPPTAGLTPSAHDMVREWTVVAALQDTDVPVAPTIALCEDPSVSGAPFTVVGYVGGTVIRTREDLEALDDVELDATVSELVSTLARLHEVAPEAVGLAGFGRPVGFLERQVALWRRQWEAVRTRDLPELEQLHEALAQAVPATSVAGIVHGDFRIDNTILALDGRRAPSVTAVVDWELATLGDPFTDVALMCAYRHPAFDAILGAPAAWTSRRMPSAGVLVDLYVAASGREVPHLPFYLGLAHLKLAVIGEGIAHRAGRGFDAAGTGAAAAEATPALVAAGLEALGR